MNYINLVLMQDWICESRKSDRRLQSETASLLPLSISPLCSTPARRGAGEWMQTQGVHRTAECHLSAAEPNTLYNPPHWCFLASRNGLFIEWLFEGFLRLFLWIVKFVCLVDKYIIFVTLSDLKILEISSSVFVLCCFRWFAASS